MPPRVPPPTRALPPSPPMQAPLISKRSRATPPSPKPRRTRFIWKMVVWVIIIGALLWCGYFMWKIYHISKTIQISSSSPEVSTLDRMRSIASSFIQTDTSTLKGASEGRINILLLGRAGIHHPGHDLTDTIMIMSINTVTKKISLLSLPRDLYVQIPDTHIFTKLNAIYQQGLANGNGVDTIETVVETITSLPIHYSFIIDFDGFEKVISALGGVNVEVMRDIYDSRYPGPNYSYETFEIKKGWQSLDGATALKYVRERHDDPEGDFGRAKRQQQVIQAVKSKAFSLKTFVDAFALSNLLDILGDSVKTTITPEEISGFIALSKQVDTTNINNVVIDAWKPESLLRVSHVFVGPVRMFTLVPRVGNYTEIHDVATNIFDINSIQRRKESILSEDASVTIIHHASKQQSLLRIKNILQENFGLTQVHIVNDTTPSTPHSTEITEDDSFIIDTTGRQKPFSLDEILKKLPLKLATDAPEFTENDPYHSDFIISVGNNLSKDLDFEEDSIEDFKKSEDDPIAYPQEMSP